MRKCVKCENRRVAGTSPRFRTCIFPRENVGKLETAKILEPLGGHVQLGGAPGGLPGPAWWPSGALLRAPGASRVSEYVIFHVFYMCFRFWALLAIRPLKKETWAELLLTP